MPPRLQEVKSRQRDVFLMGATAGALPIVFHGIVALLVWLGDITGNWLNPFDKQNWIGSGIFLGIGIGTASFINFLVKGVGKGLSWNAIKAAWALVIFLLISGLSFGILAVAKTSLSWGSAVFNCVVVAAIMILAYIIDMEVALTNVRSDNRDGRT